MSRQNRLNAKVEDIKMAKKMKKGKLGRSIWSEIKDFCSSTILLRSE